MFISYQLDYRGVAQSISNMLMPTHSVWFDKFKIDELNNSRIRDAESQLILDDEIRKGLDIADTFILIVTENLLETAIQGNSHLYYSLREEWSYVIRERLLSITESNEFIDSGVRVVPIFYGVRNNLDRLRWLYIDVLLKHALDFPSMKYSLDFQGELYKRNWGFPKYLTYPRYGGQRRFLSSCLEIDL